jgi:hypothetical protein
VNKWRVHYADGTTADSSETSHVDVRDGVLGIVEFLKPPYRRIVDGGDWFWLQGGTWRKSGTIWGGWVDRPDVKCRSCLKRGAALPDEEWVRAQARMFEDRRWPI